MSRKDQIVATLADKLIDNRKILAVVFILVTILLAWSATNIQLRPGFRKMIPTDHPYMETMMAYRDVFPSANKILFSLQWTGKGDIYNKTFLKALEQATQDIYFIKGINRQTVQSLFTPDTIYIRVTADGFKAGPVIPTIYAGTPEQIEQVKQNVLHSGMVGILVANNHKAAMIRASLLPYKSGKVNYRRIFHELQQLREKYSTGQYKKIEVDIIGFTMLLGFVIQALKFVFLFFAIAFVVTVLLLYLYTRSWKITGTALVAALLPVLWLIGVLPLIGFGIDPMTILVPFLIFATGVSHAVQMTSAWKREKIGGSDSPSAAKASFRKLFIPGAVALLTEAIGFAVIMLIQIPIVRALGITACIGVLLMIITNKMVLPIILSYMDLSDKAMAKGQKQRSSAIWDKFAVFAQPRNAIIVFVAVGLIMAFATWKSRSLVIGDTDIGAPSLWPQSTYNQDVRSITNLYSIGVNVLGVIVEAKHFEGSSCLHWPVMHLVDRFELYMQGVYGVTAVKSVAGIGKRIVAAFNEGVPKWRALPRSASGLKTASPAFDPQLGFASQGCQALRVMIFTKNHKASVIAHIVHEVEHFMATHKVEGVDMRLAMGNMGVTAATNQVIEEAEIKMLLYLFGSLIILCLLTFRSLRALLCVMVPLTGVTIMANALMVLLDIGLKVATLPVIALGVGVGIDYGIYLFERIQHNLKDEGHNFHEAFRLAMHERGSPIAFTAITMAVGVATWTMSALKYQAEMGMLLAFLFLVNMVGALILLPALGSWFYRDAGKAERSQGESETE